MAKYEKEVNGISEENNKDLKPGLPEDAVLIKTSDPWFFYFSKSRNALFAKLEITMPGRYS